MRSALLFIPPLLASAVLVLALWRTWICRREACEWVAFSGLTGATAFAAVFWQPVCQLALLPAVVLGEALALLTLSAWRFAPDHGQHGYAWAWRLALFPTLMVGLGLTAGLLLSVVGFGLGNGVSRSVVLVGSAWAGLAVAQALPPRNPARMHRRSSVTES